LAAGALWIAAALAGVGDIWDCSGTITGANSAMRIALWGLPALLFVGGLAGQAGRSLPGWALFLGQQSYAIYLFQHFGLMATAKLLGSASTLAECAALGAGALGFSLVVSGALASMWRKYVARIDLGLRRPARLGG
jgi:peptidoglycan/LPS O-acetylase OafA/YrhL